MVGGAQGTPNEPSCAPRAAGGLGHACHTRLRAGRRFSSRGACTARACVAQRSTDVSNSDLVPTRSDPIRPGIRLGQTGRTGRLSDQSNWSDRRVVGLDEPVGLGLRQKIGRAYAARAKHLGSACEHVKAPFGACSIPACSYGHFLQFVIFNLYVLCLYECENVYEILYMHTFKVFLAFFIYFSMVSKIQILANMYI